MRHALAADELERWLELLVNDAFMAAAVANCLGAFPGEQCASLEVMLWSQHARSCILGHCYCPHRPPPLPYVV
jgi:hypothetical protein